MNKEDKELQKQLVDEMMKVSKTNPDVMIYMQSLMECYENLEKELDQNKNNWKELKEYILNHYIVGHKIQNASLDNILDKMKELEGE